jgi:acyl transferase domain-containing protein
MTLPHGPSQDLLIRETYSKEGLDIGVTMYVEAHGTGTPVGDPIEAESIASAFKSGSRTIPLYIGSIKAGIGHLEAASGVAGVIKAVLALEAGTIPPVANFEKVNPNIKMDEWKMQFPMKPIPWPVSGIRRASVNSFGFGGANAHIVLDDAHSYLAERRIDGLYRSQPRTSAVNGSFIINEHGSPNGVSQSGNQMQLVTFSASDSEGVGRYTVNLLQHLESISQVYDEAEKEAYLKDLSYTHSEKRTQFSWRSFTRADSLESLISDLRRGIRDPVKVTGECNIGFVFTGQGSQWPRMGQELVRFPVFRESLYAASEYMRLMGSPWILTGIVNFLPCKASQLITAR